MESKKQNKQMNTKQKQTHGEQTGGCQRRQNGEMSEIWKGMKRSKLVVIK